MSRDNLHVRQRGEQVLLSAMACDDGDPREVEMCNKTNFELGRALLPDPGGRDDRDPDWRQRVHYSDWIAGSGALPLGPCQIVKRQNLPERRYREAWALDGPSVIVDPELGRRYYPADFPE